MTDEKVIPLRARRAAVSVNPAAAPAAPKRKAKPKPKTKRETWTAEMKRTFLANLAATANVQASIRSIGMSESAVYRLRQRSPEFRADWMAALREGYAQRGGDVFQIAAAIDAVPGLLRILPVVTGPGDILLMVPGAAQHHLGIVTQIGFVHADAGLRRIVERPGAPPWPIHGAWRVAEVG